MWMKSFSTKSTNPPPTNPNGKVSCTNPICWKGKTPFCQMIKIIGDQLREMNFPLIILSLTLINHFQVNLNPLLLSKLVCLFSTFSWNLLCFWHFGTITKSLTLCFCFFPLIFLMSYSPKQWHSIGLIFLV